MGPTPSVLTTQSRMLWIVFPPSAVRSACSAIRSSAINCGPRPVEKARCRLNLGLSMADCRAIAAL